MKRNSSSRVIKMHESQIYKAISATKQIGEITAVQKKSALDTMAFEIWTADIKVDFQTLIPVLRISGITGIKQKMVLMPYWKPKQPISELLNTTINVATTKMKVDEKSFEILKTTR
jgi:hypothetical protein